MNIFPMIQPGVVNTNTELPLYKEIEFDFEKNKIVYKNGSPSIIIGQEAVYIWALKALRTKRTRHEIYSWSYGNEIEHLIGQSYSYDLKKSEAIRYIKECLKINPYIKDVTDIEITFEDSTISIECKIITIYGEVMLNV